jgi:hypothetical protein
LIFDYFIIDYISRADDAITLTPLPPLIFATLSLTPFSSPLLMITLLRHYSLS